MAIQSKEKRNDKLKNTFNTIVPTVTAATGTKLPSIHSSPALKQPLSNICLSPGCSMHN